MTGFRRDWHAASWIQIDVDTPEGRRVLICQPKKPEADSAAHLNVRCAEVADVGRLSDGAAELFGDQRIFFFLVNGAKRIAAQRKRGIKVVS